MTVLYVIIGYLLGSISFAPFWGRVLGHKDIVAESKDGNPGTANAYLHGGFWCGTVTLLCDLGKGFLPVFLYLRWGHVTQVGGAMVLAAPVLGHIFPVYHRFRGGKGIATTFGCLLGLLPNPQPLLILIFFFLFYSLAIRVTPHFSRTIVTYLSALGVLFLSKEVIAIKLGFTVITISVGAGMLRSHEERERSRVRLLWMR